MIGLFTSLALAVPSVSGGIEGVVSKRPVHTEAGGGIRLGVHGERVSGELSVAWFGERQPKSDPVWTYGGHRRSGEVSSLVMGAFRRPLGRFTVAFDAGVGGGVRLENRCISSFVNVAWWGPRCTSYRPEPHALVSFGPRVAVGPVALFLRAEPHLAMFEDPLWKGRWRPGFWTDWRGGLRATL